MAGRSGIGDAEKAWRGVLVGSLWTPGISTKYVVFALAVEAFSVEGAVIPT